MNKRVAPIFAEDECPAVGAMCLPDISRLMAPHERPAASRSSSWLAPKTRTPKMAPTRIIMVRPGWA